MKTKRVVFESVENGWLISAYFEEEGCNGIASKDRVYVAVSNEQLIEQLALMVGVDWQITSEKS